ncbi:hypothetical protein HK100_002386, partial [Physocladia obscura]
TNNRIVLTAKHAFYQEAGSSEAHEIARVIDGMYCMNPLKSLGIAKKATSSFICTTEANLPHKYEVLHVNGSYRKPKMVVNIGDIELAKTILQTDKDAEQIETYSFTQRNSWKE